MTYQYNQKLLISNAFDPLDFSSIGLNSVDEKLRQAEEEAIKRGILWDGVINVAKILRDPTVNPKDLYEASPEIRQVIFDGSELKNEITPADLNQVVAANARILSCKKVWRIYEQNGFQQIKIVYVGKLEVGNDTFIYESRIPVPTDRRKVLISPAIHEKKNRVYVRLIAAEQQQDLNTDWAPESLTDLRACFPMLVGEDINVYLALLSLASRLNLNKDFWVMGLVIQGESSSGKSYLLQNILRPFAYLNRVEEFTRFTGAYLERKFRGRNMDEVILAIYELQEDTPQQLHLSLSEGRLRVGLVDRETDTAVEYEFEGMPFLASTTPLESLRPDLRNRVIVTAIDESEEQTKRILNFETLLASDGFKAYQLRKEAEEKARQLAAYFKKLQPAIVVVPFAEKLYERLTFYNTKLRRDWKKLLALIQASALLFQHQRRAEERDGIRVIYADLCDLQNLLTIMPAFMSTLRNLTDAQAKVLSYLSKDFAVTVRDITQKALEDGWAVSPRRIRAILEELEVLGYIIVDRDQRPYRILKLRDAPELTLEDLAAAESDSNNNNNKEYSAAETPSESNSDNCNNNKGYSATDESATQIATPDLTLKYGQLTLKDFSLVD